MKPKLAWSLAACFLVPLAIAAAPRVARNPVTFTAGGDSVEIPFLGDVVESVDGQPLTSFAVPELRKRMRTEGLALRLGMRRGEARSSVTLTTRRLI